MNEPDASTRFAIRPAVPEDIPLLVQLVKEFAEYDEMTDEFAATEARLHEAFFGERPAAEAILGELDGEPAGYAIYYRSFSSFQGRPGLYMDDLYVRPPYRRLGLGRVLLAHVARVAAERGAGRFEWKALVWNDPALRFSMAMGFEILEGWTHYRATGDAMQRLARGEFADDRPEK